MTEPQIKNNGLDRVLNVIICYEALYMLQEGCQPWYIHPTSLQQLGVVMVVSLLVSHNIIRYSEFRLEIWWMILRSGSTSWYVYGEVI